MIPVTVSGISIIVLRTATSMGVSAPAFPLRCATTSWLGSCHAQAESSPVTGVRSGRRGRGGRPVLGLFFRVRPPAEGIAQLVRIGRHDRVRAGAGDEPARDITLPLPVALLPDPEARELLLEAE